LNNPFKSLKGDESSSDVYKSLGSSERIIGILQCFEFFQPIICSGLNNFDEKNQQSYLKGTIQKMSSNLDGLMNCIINKEVESDYIDKKNNIEKSLNLYPKKCIKKL